MIKWGVVITYLVIGLILINFLGMVYYPMEGQLLSLRIAKNELMNLTETPELTSYIEERMSFEDTIMINVIFYGLIAYAAGLIAMFIYMIRKKSLHEEIEKLEDYKKLVKKHIELLNETITLIDTDNKKLDEYKRLLTMNKEKLHKKKVKIPKEY